MRPLRGHQDVSVATREESGVLCFLSRRGLTPRGLRNGRMGERAPWSGCVLLKPTFSPDHLAESLEVFPGVKNRFMEFSEDTQSFTKAINFRRWENAFAWQMD